MSLFSFKVAPGVRIRLSSRGVRTSVGPRAARLHIGGGRAGVSTGIGPVTLYQSVGGRRRRRTQSTNWATIAARQRQLAQAAKLAQARQLLAAFQALLMLPMTEPEPMHPPVAPEPPPIDEPGIRRRHAKEALKGIGIFKRAERAAAKQAATVAADAEIASLYSKACADRAWMQAHLDARWRALCENQRDEVLGALSEAFEDNEAPAAAVGVDGGEVAIVVVVPGLDIVPERMPTTTEAGNLSLSRLSKSRRSEYYTLVVCGHLLATLREAFAVAPGVTSVRAAMIRLADPVTADTSDSR